jgi:uncharacterized protein
MANFKITALNPVDQSQRVINYNSQYSTLTWEDGTPIVNTVVNNDNLAQKKLEVGKKPTTVKIQLGLSCNFECDYCNQRFVPHADSTNPQDVLPFVNNMASWFDGGDDGLGENRSFEFWGGEPLVYWKTLKPLAEELHKKYPNAKKLIITNGSLLDIEKVDWFLKYNFFVALSHDGPGQFVRGPDPLMDESSKQGVIYAYKTLAPIGKMSINAMINSKNISRKAIQKHFEDWIEENIGTQYVEYLFIGEGGFIDAYDEGGLANSLLSDEDDINFRNLSYNELREGNSYRYANVNEKIKYFIKSLEDGRRMETLTQKCGMDLKENITVDLNGNVLTCQNVSAVSTNPSGISHHLGHVSSLDNIEIKTGTHWSDRDECSKCPVLQICKGACFFLTGPLWEASCNNAFSDNIVMFATAIEMVSGHVPIYIEGPQREDRKDIFWWVNGKPEKTRKAKNIIPITAI